MKKDKLYHFAGSAIAYLILRLVGLPLMLSAYIVLVLGILKEDTDDFFSYGDIIADICGIIGGIVFLYILNL